MRENPKGNAYSVIMRVFPANCRWGRCSIMCVDMTLVLEIFSKPIPRVLIQIELVEAKGAHGRFRGAVIVHYA